MLDFGLKDMKYNKNNIYEMFSARIILMEDGETGRIYGGPPVSNRGFLNTADESTPYPE